MESIHYERVKPFRVVTLLLSLVAVGSFGQAVPDGPSLLVGGPAVVTLSDPEVAVDPQGNFVVSWHEAFTAIRWVASFDRSGVLRAGFSTSGDELVPWSQGDAAALGSGDYVVAWHPTNDSVAWRRWDVDGRPLSGEVMANEIQGPHWVDNPVVRGRPGGDLLLVWDSGASLGDDDDGTSIQGRLFDPAGPPLTSQAQINTNGAGDQERPALAVQADGGFVVVWHSDSSPGDDASGTAIVGRRYGSNGTPFGGDFQVNELTTGDQLRPSVAPLPGGGFVVAWQSEYSAGDDEDGTSIQVRWFDVGGQPIGPDEQVNTRIAGNQYVPDVAVTSEGYLEILWSGPDAQRRTYGLDGLPRSGQEMVDDTPDGAAAPDASADSNGGFVVAWTNAGYPIHVYARRYVTPLFSDGFESGDATAWSTVVP